MIGDVNHERLSPGALHARIEPRSRGTDAPTSTGLLSAFPHSAQERQTPKSRNQREAQ